MRRMRSTKHPLEVRVKEQLYPLSRLERTLEWLIECLPRKQVTTDLDPENQIAVISEEKGEFRSLGTSPTFNLVIEGGPRRGWYYLETALTRNNGSRVAKILAETNEQKIVIPIPSILRGTIREIVYFPDGIRSLKWQPTAATGFFTQSPLLFHKISVFESVARRTYRVVCDLWRFRHLSKSARLGLSWTCFFGKLQQGYQGSAKLRLQRLDGNDYTAFIVRHDTLTRSDIKSIRKQITKFPVNPLISIIMPLKKADAKQLEASLNSIDKQLYGNWELIVADASSESSEEHRTVLDFANRNNRVKVISCDAQSSTAALLNVCLQHAHGKWVCRIDPCDELSITATFLLVKEVLSDGDALLIYSDDDDISPDGHRSNPRFKPDWNPDLFTSNNYISNLVLFKMDNIKELGGFDSKFEGAEGYEAILRYLKGIDASSIRHIPKVLYHRSSLNSDTSNSEFTHEAGRLALKNYFCGSSAVAVENGPGLGLYRVKYALPHPQPLVSIIVPTRDKVDILRACVESIIRKTSYQNWELLIVDNGSSEVETTKYFDILRQDLRIKILEFGAPFNYSAINNFAVREAKGEVLALLNNDVEVISEDWLTEMVSHAVRPEVGAVGAKLLYPDGTVQHAGVVLGIGGVAGHIHRFLPGEDNGYCNRATLTQNFSAVTAACLVVRKEIYTDVGGLNEKSLRIAFNDIDFCLKIAESGYRNVFTPFALLFHHESLSRGVDDTPEKKLVFQRESLYMRKAWGGVLFCDSSYNVNLSLEHEFLGFLN